MSERKDVVPVDPTEQGPRRRTWQGILEDLEREADELRVRMTLARAEARDEWNKLEAKLDELRAKAKVAGREADDAMDDIGDKAKELWKEIKEGFGRVRRSLD